MRENIQKLKDIFTRRELIQLAGLLVAIIAMAFFQAIGIASVLPFIGLIMEPNLIFENRWLSGVYELFNFTGIRSFIVFTGLVMFALIVISNIVSALATWLKIKFSLMLNHRLSRRLLEKYLNMPYIFFLNRNSADLTNKIIGEVYQLTNNYVTPLLTVITRALVSLFVLGMLLFVDVWVSLAAIVFLGGTYAILYRRVSRSLAYRGARQAEATQMRHKAVSEAFGGIKDVKVVNREKYFLDAYSEHSYRFAELNSWHQVISQLPRFFLEAIAFGGIIIFVLVLMLTQQDARQVIPLASLFAFAGYRLMPAMQEMFQALTTIKYTQPILNRVHADIISNADSAQLPGEQPQPEIITPLPFNQTLELKNVSFIYPNSNKAVLSDLTLSIKHNSAIAIVGPTGAGKTTLVDIILGLLSPSSGSILIDDEALAGNNIKHWQRNLGYVPQHIYLSDDTVKQNIAFGLPDQQIDQDALEKAARIANIHDFINEELHQGYETLVGERGIRLSGGQRQRIGIARALYHDPSVIVFDEATSALDGYTEDSVLEALDNAAQSKTLIVIAHRLTTVKNCDQIYLVNHGRITANGTYDELMSSNEQFQKMAKVGMGE